MGLLEFARLVEELFSAFCNNDDAAVRGAKEQIFQHGRKSAFPRPITLLVEPVITIGAAGRLHTEFSWPRELIGLQPGPKWAFDLVAGRQGRPLVVCEVKKSDREIDALIRFMMDYLSRPPLDSEPTQSRARNAYRKVVALRQIKPEVFWALGPNNYGKIFRIAAADLGWATLKEVGEDALRYRPVGPM